MRSLRVVSVLALLTCGGTALAQPPGNTEIRFRPDAIIGAVAINDTLYTFRDGPVKFPLEYVNRDTNSYNGANAFRILSPDGATWGHPTGDGGNYKGFSPDVTGIWIDTTGFYPKGDLGGLYRFNCFGCDGSVVDTLMFAGAANAIDQHAFRSADSSIFFYIVIRPKLADKGKHICIDSSKSFPPSGIWQWPSFRYSPAFNTYPRWSGRTCYTLGGCCRGLTGNADCSPDDVCDIADIAALIARYTTFEDPCCPAEANVDGSPDGVCDISDLTALIDYLYIQFNPPAPCL